MSDIDPLAVSAYRAGQDPIDWACFVVESQVDCWDSIRRAREFKPDAFPVYRLPLDVRTTARRIVGCLLDAGWTPPNAATLEAAADDADEKLRQLIAICDAGEIPPEVAQHIVGLGEEWHDPKLWSARLREGLRRADP